MDLNSRKNHCVNEKRFRENETDGSASISKGSLLCYLYTLKLKYIQNQQFVYCGI